MLQCSAMDKGYRIRMITREDIRQVTEIDREAFPSQWPPANYHHEIKNPMAHYIVVIDEHSPAEDTKQRAVPKEERGLLSRLKRFFRAHRNNKPAPDSEREYIIGFAGFWLMAQEAHITSIAVREKYQRQGVGELLFLSLIELARQRKATAATLEVRASNTVAQALYAKYGFIRAGVRRGYYTDNAEDAILMTLHNLDSAEAQEALERLKQAHIRKWGMGKDSYQIVSAVPAQPGSQ